MRILAINDISCVGRCSLTVALPILNACGYTCDILPTAILSTHTGGFSDYTFLDLSDEMPKMLAQWKTLRLQYDVIYSGYLGNKKQVRLVKQIKRDFLKPNGVLIVDPVLGDNGKLYDNFDVSFVEEMKLLCRSADFILPNETEARLLTDSVASGETLLSLLQKLCPAPVLTGVVKEGTICVLYPNGCCETPYIPGFFCGSGDVFAALFTAGIADGLPLAEAVSDAANYTYRTVFRTRSDCSDHRFGPQFEPELAAFVRNRQRRIVETVRDRAIDYFEHDEARIQHFVKVEAYAEMIGAGEALSPEEMKILSIGAILHDIGIHNSEKKYGNCIGKNQEKEGPPVARELLKDLPLTEREVDAVCSMIAHHHSYSKIGDNLLLRILVEADMLVNAYEEGIPKESAARFKERVFRTKTGKKLLEKIYGV